MDRKSGPDRNVSIVHDEEVVNASGHKDQLQRQYGLLSICGLALTIDNAWVALGGSIAVSICKPILDWKNIKNPIKQASSQRWTTGCSL